MSWLRIVSPEEAHGAVKTVYDAAVKRAGRVFHIVRAMSLAPRVMDSAMGLYLSVMFGRGGLTRRQREMLAVVTSQVNDCHY